MANSKNITFDQLQSALTRIKNSLDKKANTSHGNHVPKTETANNARFLRNDNTWQTITPVNIGAADRSHNHTSLTGVTSLQFAAGSSDSAVIKVTTESANTYLDFEMNDDADSDMYRWRFSAYDTNGATSYFNLMTLTAKDTTSARLTVIGDVTASSFTGNATSATKLQTGRTLTIGNTGKKFDGSGNVSWSLSEIGAAASSHSHNYVPLSNGGSTTILADSDASTTTEYAQLQAGHNYLRVTSSAGGSTATQGTDKLTFNGNIVYHAGRKPTPSEIGAAASSHGTHVSYATATPLAAGTAAVGTSGKVAREDHVHPAQTSVSGSSGSCTGNAATATKLQTARKLTIGNTGKTFNGTADVAWSLSEIGAASSGHVHTNIKYLDKRAEDTTPANVSEGISLHLKSAGKAGLNDGGDYYASLFLKPWNDISGGPYANIAVTGNQNMWVRTSSSDSAWNNWKQIAFTSSSITGNAATATKLQNARNIKIGNTTRSFNGTADVSWSLSDIGAAASSHGHSNMLTFKSNHIGDWTDAASMSGKVYMGGWHGNITDTTKDKGYISLALGSSKSLDLYLDGDYYANENNLVLNTGNYKTYVTPANIGAANASHGTHVTYGGNGSATTVSRSDHTHSYIPLGGSASITGNLEFSNSGTTVRGVIGTMGDNDYWRIVGGATASNSGYLEIATADDANEPIYVRQYGSGKFGTLTRTATLLDASGNTSFPGTVTASSFSGNATSATRLQTARSINGTSFNGTGDITTANWGTSRTITIGSTGKSVNGSGNVSWTLAEIGAAAASHTHNYAASSHEHNYLNVKGTNTIGSVNDDTTSNWGAHKNSVHWYTTAGALKDQPSQWGYLVNIGQNSEVHQVWMTQSSGDLLHRGGNGDGWSGSWRTILDSSNYSNYAAAKSHTHNYAASNHTHNYAGSSSAGGNANAAVKLATPRSINGTNFDGSGNITTANWGTARTITIGGTGKTVNGSGNVSWSLSEIGAAASGHTHNKIQDDCYNTITIDQANDRCGLDGKNNINIATWYGFSISNNCSNYDNYGQVTFSVDARSGQVWTRGTINAPTFSGSLSGNASSATKLATARAIKIGNTSRNFDGTGNVTWTLGDIGALPAAGGTVSGNLNVSGTFSIGGKKITINSSAPSSPAVGDIWIKI